MNGRRAASPPITRIKEVDSVAKSGMTLSAGDFVARRRAPDQICRRPAPLATMCPAIAQPVKRGDKSDRARFCAGIIRKMQNAIASHLSRAPLIGQREANAWPTARSKMRRRKRSFRREGAKRGEAGRKDPHKSRRSQFCVSQSDLRISHPRLRNITKKLTVPPFITHHSTFITLAASLPCNAKVSGIRCRPHAYGIVNVNFEPSPPFDQTAIWPPSSDVRRSMDAMP